VSDIVQRAQEFATRAHQRINHQRKYTKVPYTDHLAATAKLVTTVTDDPVTIAAAWLHDTVEDTPATIQDLQKEFGDGRYRYQPPS
jgi:(p)ppGpp synthase/HD superfamily hydrolase